MEKACSLASKEVYALNLILIHNSLKRTVYFKRLLPSLQKTCNRSLHLYTSSADSFRFRTKVNLCFRLPIAILKDSNTCLATETTENSYRCLHLSNPHFAANVTSPFQIQVPLNLSPKHRTTTDVRYPKTSAPTKMLCCLPGC